MKIVFICGALEEGRDGVADYILRLAKQLIFSGNQIGIVAINDHYINEKLDEMQARKTKELSILRLPSIWSRKERIKCARKWIDAFHPDWLSLQYVIFSYHRKGLPIGFHKQLRILGKNYCWHIMFHELSVALYAEASLKEKCWGYIQRKLIHSLIEKLNPKVIHTHTRLYQAYLEEYRPGIQYLPLFSNIPLNKNHESIRLTKAVSESHRISVVVFGAIYKGGAVEQLAKEMALYGKNNNMEIELQLLGRCGKHAEMWIQTFKEEGLNVINYGEQSAEQISEILSNASVGISTTPFEMVEKSSAAAVMRAHNLHLLCVTDACTPVKKTALVFLDGVMKYSAGVFESFMLTSKCDLQIPDLDHISKVFAHSLTDYDKN